VLNGTDQDSSVELRPQSNSCPGLYRPPVRRSSAGITQANGPDNAAPPSGTKPSGGPSLVILCRSLTTAAGDVATAKLEKARRRRRDAVRHYRAPSGAGHGRGGAGWPVSVAEAEQTGLWR
jgi:hypothetical protein